MVVTTTYAAVDARPNILVIVSDDQGYADAGFQGSKDILTPHLDRLAASGVRFTNAYVSAPFCSPSRAGLMTGRYQQRFGHEGNPLYDATDHAQGLPVSETLLPAHLVPAGYTTGWIGKWHLGAAPEFAPGKRGFQKTYGFIGGIHYYRNWKTNKAVDNFSPLERGLHKYYNLIDASHYFPDWKLGFNVEHQSPVAPPEHLTTAFGHEAAAFVKEHQHEPWFLYLAFSAPHAPNQPSPESLARFSNIADPDRRAYAAQLSLLDDAIGETLDALRSTGQSDRTLVFFLTDNGGGPVGGADNKPLRGVKGMLYEGGVRVPFLMSWPTRLAAGSVDARPVSSLDVFATSLAVAGVPMPIDKKYDSVNLLPFLTGKKSGDPHQQLFWRSGKVSAVREGKWKLIRKNDSPSRLYNLDSDLSETTDLAKTQPAVRTHLEAKIDEWQKELIDPVFSGFVADRHGVKVDNSSKQLRKPTQKDRP